MSKGVNAIASNLDYAVPVTPRQFLRNADIVDGPTVLGNNNVTGAGEYFRSATILGRKSLDGTANTGSVKLGLSALASKQPYVLTSGASITIEAPLGSKFRFDGWYFVVASDGDGVVVIWS